MANGILGIIPIAQSAALAGNSINFAKQKDKDAMDFIGNGVETIVGAKLMGETANIIGSF